MTKLYEEKLAQISIACQSALSVPSPHAGCCAHLLAFFCIVFSHRRAYIRKTHAALNSFWLFNELAALFFAASRGSARDRGPTTPNYLAREMGSDTKVL
jgi:hypothetical protein